MNSVVGVGAVFNKVADEGAIPSSASSALISLALGIFNLLPFLPLDGGHILFAVDRAAQGIGAAPRHLRGASFVGLALVMLVFVFALQNDIALIRDGILNDIGR